MAMTEINLFLERNVVAKHDLVSYFDTAALRCSLKKIKIKIGG